METISRSNLVLIVHGNQTKHLKKEWNEDKMSAISLGFNISRQITGKCFKYKEHSSKDVDKTKDSFHKLLNSVIGINQ